MNELLTGVRGVSADCFRTIDRLFRLSPRSTAPVGIELIDGGFLEGFWAKIVGPDGTTADHEADVLEAFLKEYGSLEVFLEKTGEEILGNVLSWAESRFVDEVRKLNVQSIFQSVCSTSERVRAFVLQCIKESQGRVRVNGDTGHTPLWIKTLGIPEDPRMERLAKLATDLDTTQVDWHPVSFFGNEEAIYFLQYRAGLSLQNFCDGSNTISNVRSARQLAASGPDPITAFFPGSKPKRNDVDVALIKAWAIGALEISQGEGIFVRIGATREHLGDDFQEARKQLRRSYTILARIGHSFAQRLAKDPERLSAKVAGLRSGEAVEKEDGILEVVSPDAVKHVWAETIALQDYLTVPDHTDNEE